MGMLVSVYKFPMGDCTNNGISSKAESLCLVNVDGPFNPSDKQPAAMLVIGNMPGTIKIVPAMKEADKWVAEKQWCMMGGNYAATSDSRFHAAVRRITRHESYGAVPIHDRIEN